MTKSKNTGILKIKRKKFGDEVLVLYMYNGKVVYAYSPFYGETIRDVQQFLSGVMNSYRWELMREFVELSDREILDILKIPGIRDDKISVAITEKLKEILDGHKGIISYAVFDDRGFLISGFNFDPVYVPRFVKTFKILTGKLKETPVRNPDFFLTRHESDRVSIFFPLKDRYMFFFMFDSRVLHIGYVVTSLMNEIRDKLASIL